MLLKNEKRRATTLSAFQVQQERNHDHDEGHALHTNSSSLSKQAHRFLAERGLDDADITQRCGIVEIPWQQMAAISGFTWSALWLPYYLPEGKPSGFNRYRFIPGGDHAVTDDNPADAKLPVIVKKSNSKTKNSDETKNGDDAKPKTEELRYWQPRNSSVHLYLPPLVDWLKAMADWRQRLIIAEGEFKAIAACHVLKQPACGVGGVWNWKPADGLILPEFEKFVWRDPVAPAYDFDRARIVYIVFDSDVQRRGDLLAARDALVEQLTDRGADAKVINLPEVLGGENP
jgi:hypothetical protein